MKRILILLLTLVMTASIAFQGMAYGAENYSYKYGDAELAKEVAAALDIVSYTDETANDIVSRLDFAVYLAKLLKIDEYAAVDKYYFNDVDTSHYGCAVVNALCDLGIISQNDEREFNPDNAITRAEISKMLLVALGYKDYAEAKGGYPAGYLRVVAGSKIFNGIDSQKDSFTVSEAALILINAASVAMYTPKVYGADKIEYAVDNEATIFSQYYNIYVHFGILNSVGNVSLFEERSAGNGRVMVGDSYYAADKNYEDNLGEEVYAYYYSDSVNGERRLFYIRPSDTQNIVTFDTEMYVDFAGGVFSYYADGGDKQSTRRTDNNTVFIKNGEVLLYDIENEADLDFGFYKLIDSDSNGVTETVILEETETFAVGAVDNVSGVIYDKGSKNKPIYIDNYISGTVHIFDANGNEMSFESIVADDILSVVRSGDKYLKITVSKKTETAAVQSVAVNEHVVINTADKEYVIADSFADYDMQVYREPDGKLAQRFELGVDYILRFDVYGRVAYVSAVKGADEYIIGYIVNIKNEQGVFDNKLGFKLLCEDRNINIFDCSEDLKIDGVKYRSAKEAYDAVANADKVIRFKLNDENLIFDIDTSVYNEESESEYSLRCTRPYDRTAAALTYVSTTNLFGATHLADASTIVINVPVSEQGAADRDYSIGALSQFMTSTGYNVEAYKVGTEPGAESVIVSRLDNAHSDEITKRSTVIIVDEVSEVLNAEDVCVRSISGYQAGTYITMSVAESFDAAKSLKNLASDKILTLDDINRGDIIKVGKNNYDEVEKIQYYVDGDNLDATSWAPLYGTFIDRGRQELAYCLRRNGTIIEWSYTPGGELAGVIDLTSTKVVIYDADNERTPFSVGTANEIVGYETAGAECSRLFIGAYVSRVNTVIVYR